MSRSEEAKTLFHSGANCAQAIVGTFHKECGIDYDTAMRLSSGFGGGMARLREVCGAFSGMFMVASLKYGYTDLRGKKLKDKHKSFLTYLEMIINLLRILQIDKVEHSIASGALEKRRLIMENINTCIESLNQEIFINDNGQAIIVEKNASARAVAEMVDKETSFKVIEYNHHALKGNLNRKREILKALGDVFEPLKPILKKDNEFTSIEDNAGFLLNSIHIRHNNKAGSYEHDFIVKMNDNELEAWYDKAYDVLLFAIQANNIIDIKKEIKQLKRDISTGDKSNG